MTRRSALLHTTALLALAAPGLLSGCQSDVAYSQSALNSLQTREFNFTIDKTFDACVGSLFDLGYTIRSSDKRGGFVSAVNQGSMLQIKLDQLGPTNTAVRVSTSAGGQTRVDKPLIDAFFNTLERRLLTAERGT